MLNVKRSILLGLMTGLALGVGCDSDHPNLDPSQVGVEDVLGGVDNGQQIGGTNPNGQVIGGGGSGGNGATTCGNGTIEAGEQCDGANLGGADCVKLGTAGGTLLCDPTTCTIDDSMCMGAGGGGGGGTGG